MNLPPTIRAASLTGNTAGVMANISSGTLYLAGGNNVTLSQNANSVTISGIAVGSQSAGMSNLGNTSGTTGIASGPAVQFVYVGGNNVTLSQSLNGASGTITMLGINPGAQNMNFWQNMGVNGSATDAMGQQSVVFNDIQIFQMDIGNNIFAGDMTVNTVLLDMTCSVNATINNYTVSALFGIYTIAGTVLSLLNSGSVSFGTSLIGSSTSPVNHQSLINGKRYLTMHSSVFSSNLTMSQGLYYGAMLYRSAGGASAISMSNYGAILGESGQRSGTLGAASVNDTYIGAMPYMGRFSATSSAFPTSIGSNAIRKTAVRDIFVPHIMFNNIQASF